MPPKKTSSLTKLKSNISEKNSISSGAWSSKKQVTISKFFAAKVLVQKHDDSATDDVDIVIDRSSVNKDNVKEVKVRSPLKKRPRENAELEEASSKRKKENAQKESPNNKEFNLTSGSLNTSKINVYNQKEIVRTKLDGSGGIKNYQVSAETKEKLKVFGVSSDYTDSAMVVDFDLNSLKRKRAAELPDINEDEKRKREEKLDASFENDENEDESKSDLETFATTSKGNNSASENNESKPKSKSFLSQFAAIKPASKGLRKVGTNYTKLELQYLEIKDKYPDAILFVECGYKYRFFREDAEIAAKVLKIYCHLDHNFMTASIPVHRLFVHVRRLVAAGYKVGVVKQTETAALKAAGDNRNTPFTHPIQGAPEGSVGGVGTNTFLMCVCDSFQDKNSKGQQIGIVAVQPATGEVIYDSFEGGDSQRELETRISHISPVEVILQNSVSISTEKLIKGLQTISSVEDDKMRVEKLEDGIFTYSKAFDIVSEFYGTGSSKGSCTLQEVLNLPKPVICCLSGLITYLRDFNLDKVLRDTSAFTMFSVKSKYMQLDGNTMRNLELFQNDTNGKEAGSLFWVLNQTVTKFGARMLRVWISRPLLSRSEIESRQKCIQELISDVYPDLKKLRETLAKCPDLEKGLCSVYHKKCGPLEFYTVCKSLHQIHGEMKLQKEALGQQLGSSLLTHIVMETCDLLNDISTFSTGINENAARVNDKTKLFSDESQFLDIGERKSEIQSVMKELEDHLQDLKRTLMEPSLEYMTVLGTEYQVKVRNTLLKKVPSDWIKITSTKEVSRFHSPFIVEKCKQLSQLREQLVLDCNKAWIQFLE
ncbi:hypothetical protein CHS0354_022310 [Potamilus streckersoni]|uniref:DNA mismatch repair protein MSH3 n=1 Tax=Potamilus streckersoni TaxID=2493646 RepID=A0AAE0WD28_9BIVA|nr:hypothetical protein CHS0354_022310 [Potamilus streckersoni]